MNNEDVKRALDYITGASRMIDQKTQMLRKHFADCSQPALADAPSSREFCRCERCQDRRDRRVADRRGSNQFPVLCDHRERTRRKS